APYRRLLHAAVHRGYVLGRNGAAHYGVAEVVAGPARRRAHAHPAVAELAAPARLLLVTPLPLRLTSYRLPVRNLRPGELHLHPVAPLQPRHRHLQVPLAHTRHDRLPGFRNEVRLQRGVLVMQAVETHLHLLLVTPARRLNRKGNE